MDGANENGKRDFCHHMETSFLAPSTMLSQKLGGLLTLGGHLHSGWRVTEATLSGFQPSSWRPGLTIHAPSRYTTSGHTLVFGSKNSSTVSGPIYFFFSLSLIWRRRRLKERLRENWFPVSAVSWVPESHVYRWAAGCLVQQAVWLETKATHATTLPGWEAEPMAFHCRVDASPLKPSSGVVLHQLSPTCSFFCMYYCLFIKGFEVLSQW